ncbi:hypothetical protein SY86_17190 [Erwinia tracheiphila]|uniref:HTH luxR-type domain-containing protein n=1 Tax=Erwinia tracheiphila TaxID=65700 RepID=A0A0M2KKW0_9GAMM|nr:hypothetical protein SY86_17190 [Erwinia tracheiphila]
MFHASNSVDRKVLKISIKSENCYYASGLMFLIKELNDEMDNVSPCIIADDVVENKNDMENIIVRDAMISINLRRNKRYWKNDTNTECLTAIHIPFICRQNAVPEIIAKLKKILIIASMGYSSLSCPEYYEMIGLKKFKQLSLTECKILLLVGKGYNIGYISRVLNRSEKTISNHCRNSIRKLGMLNRIEFYKYASFIARCNYKERGILCL